ncbi:hypothetical protein AA313_de0206073 [Arthrobotrys entomopaga]|nr:hypothetical protein AA313_de0206073 [Arthrobotrys entomopaga]
MAHPVACPTTTNGMTTMNGSVLMVMTMTVIVNPVGGGNGAMDLIPRVAVTAPTTMITPLDISLVTGFPPRIEDLIDPVRRTTTRTTKNPAEATRDPLRPIHDTTEGPRLTIETMTNTAAANITIEMHRNDTTVKEARTTANLHEMSC